MVGFNDYLPGGSPMLGRTFSANSYKYGYQGSEKDDEISGSGNHITTFFREGDTRLLKWWSVDPKAKPWESPYAWMGSNPILMSDPMGDKEYENADAYAKANKGKTWDKNKGKGDWLAADRSDNTDVWKNANTFNLQQKKGYEEYINISQRTDFYKWFDNTRKEQGHEIEWVAAASVVAAQMAQTETWQGAFVSDDVKKFAQAGNEAIFNDVFDNLRDVSNSTTPIVGDAARKWDIKTLYHEQYEVVQPIYKIQTKETIQTLSNMAKGNFPYNFGVPEKVRFKGDVTNPKDRYIHGMTKVLDYYRSQQPKK